MNRWNLTHSILAAKQHSALILPCRVLVDKYDNLYRSKLSTGLLNWRPRYRSAAEQFCKAAAMFNMESRPGKN